MGRNIEDITREFVQAMDDNNDEAAKRCFVEGIVWLGGTLTTIAVTLQFIEQHQRGQ